MIRSFSIFAVLMAMLGTAPESLIAQPQRQVFAFLFWAAIFVVVAEIAVKVWQRVRADSDAPAS